CYKCHEVKGETFPSTADTENVGPELSAMAPLHDVEYFAESIVNPRKAAEKGKMPSFNDSMTVQELVDLVAYLKSLKAPRAAPADVGRAIDGALAAHREWSRMDWRDRAAIFLRAADLLAGPYRMVLNAATMLGQSKTVYQAEIDAACELIDFWRFNVAFAEEIYRQQPFSSPA